MFFKQNAEKERQNLEKELTMLHEQYNELLERERRVRMASARENNPSIKFQYEQEIKELERQRGEITTQSQEIMKRIQASEVAGGTSQPGTGQTPTSAGSFTGTSQPGTRSAPPKNRNSHLKRNIAVAGIIVVILIAASIFSYNAVNNFLVNRPTSFPVNFLCTGCDYAELGVTLDAVTFDTAHSSTTLQFTINNTGSHGCSNISFSTLYLQDIEGTQYSPQQTNRFSVAPGQHVGDTEVISSFIPLSATPYTLNLAVSVYNCSQQENNTYQTETILFQSPDTSKGPGGNTHSINQQLLCTTCNYSGLKVVLDSVMVDTGSNKTILHFRISDTGVTACSGISFSNIQLQDSGGNNFSPSQRNTFSIAASHTIDDYEVIDKLTPTSGTKYSLISPAISVYGCSQSETNTYQNIDITF